MGDRDRYYDRGEAPHDREDSPYREQRGAREWDPRDDYRSAGRERPRGFSGPQDYRNYGARGGGYSGSESWSAPRSFGAYDPRSYERDVDRGRDERENRYGRGGEGQRDPWNDRSAFDASYGRGYGSGYRDRDFGEWERQVTREPYGLYYSGYGSYRGNEGERGGPPRDESFGQHMREVGQRVMSKVKRAFRGPKGYKRSDDRIREDVNDRFSEQDDFDPTELEVSVSNGEVTLIGCVESRRAKFLAEEIADDVSGVTEVHNQLRVGRVQSTPAGVASTESTPSISSTSPGDNDAPRTRSARPQ